MMMGRPTGPSAPGPKPPGPAEDDRARRRHDRPAGPRDLHEPETVSPADSAAELAGILDGYMADLQAGKAPDRGELLAAHPELAAQLEACLAGIEFVHRATGPAAEEPAALGEFRIVRELGRGGMGVVYEAEQTSLRRRVALKVLRFGAVADEEAMQRFRREAETVARLHHTNIVPIFAVGCERGVHYYAMQFIEGRSLADVLDESQRTGKPLAAEDVARWGLQAAEALAHAHQRGVIHRDIKPSNLLIDTEGVVWLTDFGLAKRADEVTLTVSGALMGTPRYMSPEQAESLQRPIDHRTDLYSLGASLYELATGRPVFESATPHGVIVQILTEEPARPRQIRPDLPRDLETIILTCLAKDPAQRYQTAQALADDLRAVLEGRPIQARRVPLVERVTRYVRKRKKAIGAGAIVVAATTLLIVGSFLGWRFYSEWRLGRVVLSTDGPPLTAQVLAESGDEADRRAVRRRHAHRPAAAGRRLPAARHGYGSARSNVPVRGQPRRDAAPIASRSTRTACWGRSRSRMRSPRKPWGSRRARRTSSSGPAQTLIRRDGATGKPIWDAVAAGEAVGPEARPGRVDAPAVVLRRRQRPGTLVQPAPDLDGDGTGDIVWAFPARPRSWHSRARMGRCSGPTRPRPRAPAVRTPRPGWTRSIEQDPRPGRVLGAPSLRRRRRRRHADLIAAFAIIDDGRRGLRRSDRTRSRPCWSSDRIKPAAGGSSWPSRAVRDEALWSHPIDAQIDDVAVTTLRRGTPCSAEAEGLDRRVRRGLAGGSASTRRPANRGADPSTWGSCPSARSSTRTWTATANPR